MAEIELAPEKLKTSSNWPYRFAALLIVILAAVIRIYNLGDLPAGFYCDEASIGYNAYCILETGKDEFGIAMPLYFKAFGEYKNPIYIYAAVPAIALFDLSEFSTRLPAAVFGCLLVWMTYLFGTSLFNRRIGLFASLFLAVSPWHIQFSRIAFELISLPLFFTTGLYFLMTGMKRLVTDGEYLSIPFRRILTPWRIYLGAVFMGATLYTYAVARLLVPLFLIVLIFINVKIVIRNKKVLVAALLLFVITLIPMGLFAHAQPNAFNARFDQISILSMSQDPVQLAEIFFKKYQSHLSFRFLFERGDPILRHSVQGFGMLHPVHKPLIIIGILFCFFYFKREHLAIIAWLLLFPVAASLTKETPTATRTIIALPMFQLLAAIGLDQFFTLWNKIKFRWIRFPLHIATVVTLMYFLVPQVQTYLDAYINKYPVQSARGIYGFQYGYRDMIQYMESVRDQYDSLILTAKSVNRPYIFALFYSKTDPAQYQKTRRSNYAVFLPENRTRYSTDERVLFALRKDELAIYSDYDIKKTITSPDGKDVFFVTHVKARKQFINDWLILGTYDNERNEGWKNELEPEYTPFDRQREYITRENRTSKWQSYNRKNKDVIDLNTFFSHEPFQSPRNAEHSCAYLYNVVISPIAQGAILAMNGSTDPMKCWINGQLAGDYRFRGDDDIYEIPINLNEGENEILVKSCESVGSWELYIRILDASGTADLSNISLKH